MTDTQDTTTDAPAEKAKKRGGGISAMLLPELKSLAGALGIKGTGSMKKAQLIDAIKAHQAGQPASKKADKAGAPDRAGPQPDEPLSSPTAPTSRRQGR